MKKTKLLIILVVVAASLSTWTVINRYLGRDQMLNNALAVHEINAAYGTFSNQELDQVKLVCDFTIVSDQLPAEWQAHPESIIGNIDTVIEWTKGSEKIETRFEKVPVFDDPKKNLGMAQYLQGHKNIIEDIFENAYFIRVGPIPALKDAPISIYQDANGKVRVDVEDSTSKGIMRFTIEDLGLKMEVEAINRDGALLKTFNAEFSQIDRLLFLSQVKVRRHVVKNEERHINVVYKKVEGIVMPSVINYEYADGNVTARYALVVKKASFVNTDQV